MIKLGNLKVYYQIIIYNYYTRRIYSPGFLYLEMKSNLISTNFIDFIGRQFASKKSCIFNSLITNYGVFQNVITLKDLFK